MEDHPVAVEGSGVVPAWGCYGSGSADFPLNETCVELCLNLSLHCSGTGAQGHPCWANHSGCWVGGKGGQRGSWGPLGGVSRGEGMSGWGQGAENQTPKVWKWAEQVGRVQDGQRPGTRDRGALGEEGVWDRVASGTRSRRGLGRGCHGGCLSGSEGGVRWEVVLKVQGEAVTGGAPGLRVGGGAGGGGGGRRQAEGAGACGAGWGRTAGAEMGGDPTLAVPGYGRRLHPLGHLMGPPSMRPGPCS